MRLQELLLVLAALIIAIHAMPKEVLDAARPTRRGKFGSKVLGGAHFGWGLPMDEMEDDEGKVENGM